jgi:hypothetical protein
MLAGTPTSAGGYLFSLRNIFNIEAEHQRPQKI